MRYSSNNFTGDLPGFSEMMRYRSADDSRNLIFDNAKSWEYCLGNLPLGRIPTQEKTAWPDADSCRSCWVSLF